MNKVDILLISIFWRIGVFDVGVHFGILALA